MAGNYETGGISRGRYDSRGRVPGLTDEPAHVVLALKPTKILNFTFIHQSAVYILAVPRKGSDQLFVTLSIHLSLCAQTAYPNPFRARHCKM